MVGSRKGQVDERLKNCCWSKIPKKPTPGFTRGRSRVSEKILLKKIDSDQSSRIGVQALTLFRLDARRPDDRAIAREAIDDQDAKILRRAADHRQAVLIKLGLHIGSSKR